MSPEHFSNKNNNNPKNSNKKKNILAKELLNYYSSSYSKDSNLEKILNNLSRKERLSKEELNDLLENLDNLILEIQKKLETTIKTKTQIWNEIIKNEKEIKDIIEIIKKLLEKLKPKPIKEKINLLIIFKKLKTINTKINIKIKNIELIKNTEKIEKIKKELETINLELKTINLELKILKQNLEKIFQQQLQGFNIKQTKTYKN